MIAILIAAGLLGSIPSEPSNVTTPASRTITLTPTGATASAQQILDPSDILDFVLDLEQLLGAGEQFTSLNLDVVPASAALGFQILEDAPYAPEEIDDSHVRIWPSIGVSSRNLSAWTSGTSCSIEVTATTNSVPPRTWQKTVSIRVAQL
jgi:hypothetical protein